MAVFGADMASANLVTNGSFEADTVSGTYVANGFEYMNRPLMTPSISRWLMA